MFSLIADWTRVGSKLCYTQIYYALLTAISSCELLCQQVPHLNFIPRCTIVVGNYGISSMSVYPHVYAQYFWSITWVFIHRRSLNFAYTLSGGIVLGKSIHFKSYCPCSYWKKGFWLIIPLLFTIIEWNFTDMFNIKSFLLWRRSGTLTFSNCMLSVLDKSKNCIWPVIP